MIKVQGGDPDAPLPQRRRTGGRAACRRATAGSPGWTRVAVGVAAWRLGAGRARKEDAVSHTAGVRCLAKPGDYVRPGSRCSSCTPTTRAGSPRALEALEGARDDRQRAAAARVALIVDQVGV